MPGQDPGGPPIGGGCMPGQIDVGGCMPGVALGHPGDPLGHPGGAPHGEPHISLQLTTRPPKLAKMVS